MLGFGIFSTPAPLRLAHSSANVILWQRYDFLLKISTHHNDISRDYFPTIPKSCQLCTTHLVACNLFVSNVICCYWFPTLLSPYRTCFFSMYEMFFISRPPICIWGDIGAKSEKIAIKCTSQETTANFANQRKQNRVISNKHPSQALHIVRSLMRILPTKKVPQFSYFGMRPPKGCFTRTYARASNSDFTFLLSQVSQRAKNESSIRPPIRYSFSKNNVSFSIKQRVVFNKTTCRFQQNNVLFVKVRRLALSSLYELRKSYFWWLFGDIARSKSKQMFTKHITNTISTYCIDHCDTCDSKNTKTPVMYARIHA